MDTISLKLKSKYKSLQQGFEWNNIPSFAVITGVNGVGKTQLLEAIKGRSERPDERGIIQPIVREITSSNGPEFLVFSENTAQRGLSLNGLIEYVQNTDHRLLTNRDLDQYIRNCQTNINSLQQQYSQTTEKIARLQLENNIRSKEEQIRSTADAYLQSGAEQSGRTVERFAEGRLQVDAGHAEP